MGHKVYTRSDKANNKNLTISLELMIEINIERTKKNKRKFASIALIIDKNEFVETAKRIRRKYKIESNRACPHVKRAHKYPLNILKGKIDNTEILRLWFSNKFGLMNDIFKDHWTFKGDPITRTYQNMMTVNEVDKILYRNKNATKIAQDFNEDIVNIRKKMRLTSRMERVMAHAILCNCVNENDISLAYAKRYFAEGEQKYTGVFDGFVMYISLEATAEDVRKAYERDIKPIQGHYYGIDEALPDETKASIYEDREIYWKKKGGTPRLHIAADKAGVSRKQYLIYQKLDKNTETDKNRSGRKIAERKIREVLSADETVKKALQRYRKLLTETHISPSEKY